MNNTQQEQLEKEARFKERFMRGIALESEFFPRFCTEQGDETASWMEFTEDTSVDEVIEFILNRDEEIKRVTQAEERRKYITEVLTDQHKSELEGKSYDFYFKLRTDLDQLNQDNE